MVTVNIDIRNIASQTYPGDRVTFRSPVIREASGGGLVSTADESVTLTDGVGSVDLTPGPVIVTFQCRGITDNSPKRGVVPDSGPVTLSSIITGNLTFTPEVVGAAQAARNQAVQAAADAVAASTSATGSADKAATAALSATSNASTAVTKADEAAASASTASGAATTATSARDAAVVARTAAEKAATDTSSALDVRIPAGLALRLDATVGTRVFAGDTMIYGDTGWRDISTLTEGIDFLRITRTGNRISIVGGGVRVATGGTYLTKALPAGFIPAVQGIPWGFMVIKSAMYPVGNASALNRLNYQSPPYASSVAVGDQVTLEASWITRDPWPTSLPGLPV